MISCVHAGEVSYWEVRAKKVNYSGDASDSGVDPLIADANTGPVANFCQRTTDAAHPLGPLYCLSIVS